MVNATIRRPSPTGLTANMRERLIDNNIHDSITTVKKIDDLTGYYTPTSSPLNHQANPLIFQTTYSRQLLISKFTFPNLSLDLIAFTISFSSVLILVDLHGCNSSLNLIALTITFQNPTRSAAAARLLRGCWKLLQDCWKLLRDCWKLLQGCCELLRAVGIQF
ncbi:hypothetical protein R6Q59_031633 [Mikania micrantha]